MPRCSHCHQAGHTARTCDHTIKWECPRGINRQQFDENPLWNTIGRWGGNMANVFQGPPPKLVAWSRPGQYPYDPNTGQNLQRFYKLSEPVQNGILSCEAGAGGRNGLPPTQNQSRDYVAFMLWCSYSMTMTNIMERTVGNRIVNHDFVRNVVVPYIRSHPVYANQLFTCVDGRYTVPRPFERPAQVQPRTTTRKQMPKHIADQIWLLNEPDCMICLSPTTEETYALSECGHDYCKKCLTDTRLKKCGVCRIDL